MRSARLSVVPLFFLLSCQGPQKAVLKKSILPASPLPPHAMVVNVPVSDVRSTPTPRNDKYEYDPLQETQVVKGEIVFVHQKKDGWAYVECVEQMEYTHNSRWEGYPGWTPLINLTSDATRQSLPRFISAGEADVRSLVLEAAARHVGSPYLWGGRSLHNPRYKKTLTGVDCSGLISWSFRQIGRLVPRDAHEQYMKARRLDPSELKPADLFFLAKADKPEKIVHVGFVKGPERLLEAPQSGEKVRDITFLERFGKNLQELKNGDVVGDRVIYFGTLFTEGS